MTTLQFLVIFLIILFIYLHLLNEFKTSNKLSIYEIDYISNGHLQEICELKQPFIFNSNEEIKTLCNEVINDLENNEYSLKLFNAVDESDDEYVMLESKPAMKMLQSSGSYYSQYNWNIVESKELINSINKHWRPHFTLNTYVDIRTGCKNVTTKPLHHKHNRMFLCVMKGSLHVKMTPSEYEKYLQISPNYENMEYNSPLDFWAKSNMDENVKFVEFTIPSGSVLFVPPYWTISTKYDTNTVVYEINYMSILNSIIHIPDYTLHFIQKNNNEILLKDFNSEESKDEETKEEVITDVIVSSDPSTE